jgi:Tfp pilus assembly ATPase PilU
MKARPDLEREPETELAIALKDIGRFRVNVVQAAR